MCLDGWRWYSYLSKWKKINQNSSSSTYSKMGDKIEAKNMRKKYFCHYRGLSMIANTFFEAKINMHQ